MSAGVRQRGGDRLRSGCALRGGFQAGRSVITNPVRLWMFVRGVLWHLLEECPRRWLHAATLLVVELAPGVVTAHPPSGILRGVALGSVEGDAAGAPVAVDEDFDLVPRGSIGRHWTALGVGPRAQPDQDTFGQEGQAVLVKAGDEPVVPHPDVLPHPAGCGDVWHPSWHDARHRRRRAQGPV